MHFKIIPFNKFISGVAKDQGVSEYAALLREYNWFLKSAFPSDIIPSVAYDFRNKDSEIFVESFLEVYMCRKADINYYMEVFKLGVSS